MTAVWLAGVLIGLIRIGAGCGRVAAMIRSSQPLDLKRHRGALSKAREQFGRTEFPRVVTSREAVGPFAAGQLWSCIVLPEGLAEESTTQQLSEVLIHECAHIIRGDPWFGLLQRLAAAFYWPHPLVHYLNGQLSRAREEVCDNFVLRGSDACGYARTLLTLTERCRPPGGVAPGWVCSLLGGRWPTGSAGCSTRRGRL